MKTPSGGISRALQAATEDIVFIDVRGCFGGLLWAEFCGLAREAQEIFTGTLFVGVLHELDRISWNG